MPSIASPASNAADDSGPNTIPAKESDVLLDMLAVESRGCAVPKEEILPLLYRPFRWHVPRVLNPMISPTLVCSSPSETLK